MNEKRAKACFRGEYIATDERRKGFKSYRNALFIATLSNAGRKSVLRLSCFFFSLSPNDNTREGFSSPPSLQYSGEKNTEWQEWKYAIRREYNKSGSGCDSRCAYIFKMQKRECCYYYYYYYTSWLISLIVLLKYLIRRYLGRIRLYHVHVSSIKLHRNHFVLDLIYCNEELLRVRYFPLFVRERGTIRDGNNVVEVVQVGLFGGKKCISDWVRGRSVGKEEGRKNDWRKKGGLWTGRNDWTNDLVENAIVCWRIIARR